MSSSAITCHKVRNGKLKIPLDIDYCSFAFYQQKKNHIPPLLAVEHDGKRIRREGFRKLDNERQTNDSQKIELEKLAALDHLIYINRKDQPRLSFTYKVLYILESLIPASETVVYNA